MPILLKYPTSTGTTAGSGSNGTWSNPSNIFAADAAVASAAFLLDISGINKVALADLTAKGFGYSLPSSAVVDGIQLEYKVTSSNRWSEANSYIRLMKAGVIAGSNKAGTGATASGVWTYGGPSDLWGTTWNASDINNANFGANLNFDGLTSSPADYQISIDYVRVTVYYHLSGTTAPSDVPTRELYKVYNQQGQYLGMLPVTEPMKIAQDINTLGSQVTIKVPISSDTSSQPSEIYTTEDTTANYTNEAATDNYTTEGAVPIVSAAFQGIDTLIKNGNTVQMWLYNYWYPNGKCMLIGKIRRWEADFGGDGGSNDVSIVIYSSGYDLDNYIARGAPFTYTNDQVQNTYNNSDVTFVQGDKGGGWHLDGQTFVVGAGVTNIGAISVACNAFAGPTPVTLNLYNGLSGSLLGSVRIICNSGAQQFGFPNLITVTPGQALFFNLVPDSGTQIGFGYQTGNPYANGSMYTSDYSGGSGGGSWVISSGNDLWFTTAAGTLTTSATFTSKDPTIGIIAPIISDYNLRGGSQVWTASSIDATGLSLTYRFNVQTIYEAMQAVLSLCPYGFYYYVDLGAQVIYFKNASTTADFLFIKGVHINSLKLSTTTESSINTVLFTGGVISTPPDVNLYKQYASNLSINAFGPLLDRKTDSRVTLTPTADAIGNSEIAELSGEMYQTTVTILHTQRLDITKLVPGKVIGFRGFGTFVDLILAQIVHREWIANSVVLTLGVLPKRLNVEYENTLRSLIAAQTTDNPSSPT